MLSEQRLLDTMRLTLAGDEMWIGARPPVADRIRVSFIEKNLSSERAKKFIIIESKVSPRWHYTYWKFRRFRRI